MMTLTGGGVLRGGDEEVADERSHKGAAAGHARALCEVCVCVVRPLLLSFLGAFNKGDGRMGEKGREGEAKDAPIISHADAAFFRPSARHVSRCLAQRCLS